METESQRGDDDIRDAPISKNQQAIVEGTIPRLNLPDKLKAKPGHASARLYKEPGVATTSRPRWTSRKPGDAVEEDKLLPLPTGTRGEKEPKTPTLPPTPLLDNDVFEASLLEEIETYVRDKIQANEVKDIQAYVLARLSENQVRTWLPGMVERLQKDLLDNGTSSSLETQSSLCIVMDGLSQIGVASPLVGMYTDEEEEMLAKLELRTVL
ncbi:unnamed protein product [Aphanomyces euteiches]|uniref:Uncharacterized protein n=1 Tax=Aphanomyces euteiches TaxID=100861 RepID=A0A6G0WTK1_9STRA|nr:hypothetical protein Ae201684_011877 [Aphanomyces euteiches]KAH9089249.1 hypothetical protein Ae201684P_001453 [Aphanomyces euteiches]KAH9092377.1 hypothetical protein LEN26_018432 [Aphanomyces euteiches]KAH9115612.1 hypothetical protein AeMF1_010361 [Aphanomyces euteiches]KAH9154790.1 hypothetical protein AeRB84_003180 [Aphanomyces euteiches]